MVLYLVLSYNVREGKGDEFISWIVSDEVKKLFEKLKLEFNITHMADYYISYGGHTHKFQTWLELQNFGSLDKLNESRVWLELNKELKKFILLENIISSIYLPIINKNKLVIL
jgi:hypothetical protein